MFDFQKTNQMHADAIVALFVCVSVILFVAQIINEYKIQEICEIQQSVSGHVRQKRRQNRVWTHCVSGDETRHYGRMHDWTHAIVSRLRETKENARGDVRNRACEVPVWIDGYACNQLDCETLRASRTQIESVSVSDCRCVSVSVSGRQENGRVSVSEIGEEIGEEIAHAQIREIGRENAHVEIINRVSRPDATSGRERVSYMNVKKMNPDASTTRAIEIKRVSLCANIIRERVENSHADVDAIRVIRTRLEEIVFAVLDLK
jgi:hypothetical protein